MSQPGHLMARGPEWTRSRTARGRGLRRARGDVGLRGSHWHRDRGADHPQPRRARARRCRSSGNVRRQCGPGERPLGELSEGLHVDGPWELVPRMPASSKEASLASLPPTQRMRLPGAPSCQRRRRPASANGTSFRSATRNAPTAAFTSNNSMASSTRSTRPGLAPEATRRPSSRARRGEERTMIRARAMGTVYGRPGPIPTPDRWTAGAPPWDGPNPVHGKSGGAALTPRAAGCL